MVERFVATQTIVAAPSDGNDGRDALGCALSNASYDHAGGATYSDRQLTAAVGTPFTGTQALDRIYLKNASGFADGLYELQAVDVGGAIVQLSADSRLTVDSAGDVDSGSGPWATLQYAFDTAGSGKLVHVCDGTWTPTTSVVVDTQGTNPTNPITFTGASSRGLIDGTQVIVSGTSLIGLVDLMSFSGTHINGHHYNIRDLRFTGGGGGRDTCRFASSSCDVQFFNCRIDSAVQHGIRITGPSDKVSLYDCEIDSHTFRGTQSGGLGQGRITMQRCSVHDNTLDGAYIAPVAGQIIDCLFYDNGQYGIRFYPSTNANIVIDGNNFYGNTLSGLFFSGSGRVSISNNHFVSNGGYGIDFNGNEAAISDFRNNLFYDNASGTTNGTPTTSSGNIEGEDPNFVSVVDGSEDFRLQEGSPSRRTGLGVETA